MADRKVVDLGDDAPRLASVAYDQLLELLLSGALPAGSIVQERLLSRRLGLSRTPIREALVRLEGEGLLVRASARVLGVNRVTVADFIQILAVRRLLEAEAVGLAVGHMPQAQALIDEIATLMERGNVSPEDHRKLDQRIHESIARASGNDVLLRHIVDLRRRTAMFDKKRIPDRFEQSCSEHIGILSAIVDGDADAAQVRMMAHIDHVRTSILGRLGASGLHGDGRAL